MQRKMNESKLGWIKIHLPINWRIRCNLKKWIKNRIWVKVELKKILKINKLNEKMKNNEWWKIQQK